MYETIQQIEDANKAAGGNFFNSDRMRELWTCVDNDVINGNMFITSETSERQTLSSQRLYTIRRMLANGLIGTVGKFQQYVFYEDARDAARRLGGGSEVGGGATAGAGATLRWRGNSKIRIEIGDLWIELHPPDGSGGHPFFTLFSSSKTKEISGREPELITMKFDDASTRTGRARREMRRSAAGTA